MATPVQNMDRARAAIDLAKEYIEEMGVHVPDNITAEEQMSKILDILGGEDYVLLNVEARDVVTGEGVAGASVSASTGDEQLPDIICNADGKARRRWFMDRTKYDTLRAVERAKIGAYKPSYVKTNVANPLHTANQTVLCWFRSAPADAPGGSGNIVRNTNGYGGLPYVLLYSNPDSTQKRGCDTKINFGGTNLSFGFQPYDTDMIMAARRGDNGDVSAFLFDRKIDGTSGAGLNDDRTFSIGTREASSLLYQHYGNVYEVHVYNTALSDAEIYNKMATGDASGAAAAFKPDGVSDSAWTSSDGLTTLPKFQETAEIIYQGQLKALFSKEGYVDELQYVELPDFETALDGIGINQSMYKEDELSVSPNRITFSAEGGTQTVQITSPWDIRGVLPLADWITTSLNGNTLTVTVPANNTGSLNSGEIAIITGDKQLRIPVSQPVINLTDLKIGDNLRGKTVTFVNKDKTVDFTTPDGENQGGLIGFAGGGYLASLQSGDSIVMALVLSDETPIVIYDSTGEYGTGWINTEVTFPDTEDYIIDYIYLGEIQPGNWSWDDTIVADPDVKLTDLQVGDNLRGATILFTNTDLTPTWRYMFDNEISVGGVLNSVRLFTVFSTLDGGAGGEDEIGCSVIQYRVMWNVNTGWQNTSFTFPDDKDYIVTWNNLVAAPDGGWGFQYAIVKDLNNG